MLREDIMDRRTFVIGTAASTAALGVGPAFTQDAFPSHAITIINAFPPGGVNDIVTRPFASALELFLRRLLFLSDRLIWTVRVPRYTPVVGFLSG